MRIDASFSTREAWDELLARAPRCALQQGWAYSAALSAQGARVHRLLVRDDEGLPLACAQVVERRLLGLLRACFLLRGPVWLVELAEARQREGLAALHTWLRRPLLIWAPEATSAPAGRRAVITGYSTSWVELGLPAAAMRRRLHPNWRHRLGQAERHGLEVRVERGAEGLRWLLTQNEAQRRRVGYKGPSPGFLHALAQAAGDDALLLTAWEQGERTAGVLLLRHGRAATYEVGHVTSRGRRLNAKHLLLWQGMLHLSERGVRWLDLGGIDTERAPTLARFKLGLGGEATTLAGTFLIPAWAQQ